MKRPVIFTLLIALCISVPALGQEQWEPVVDGIYEGHQVNLFHPSVKRGKAAPADMDGDGDIDLLIGGDYYVRYFRNDGTPSAPSWTLADGNLLNMPQTLSYHMLDPAAYDFDGDGDVDVVVATWGGNVYYYRNEGGMTFTQTTSSLVPNLGGHASIDLKDLNNDGRMDLILAVDSGKVWFFPNAGGTTDPYPLFDSPIDLGFQAFGSNSRAISLADLDGDGDFDLFSGTATGQDLAPYRFEFYLNAGTVESPVFTLENSDYFPDIPDNFWPIPTLFDADSDGDADCLLFVYTAGGFYGFKKNVGTASAPQWNLTHDYFQTFSYKHLSGIAAFADLDGDGDLDAIQSGQKTAFGLFENRGCPTAPNWVLLDEMAFPHTTEFYSCSSYDIDNDNDMDFFAVDVGGMYPLGPRIYFWKNNGSPYSPAFALESTGWQGIKADTLPSGGWFTSLCFGDLNGDGLADLVMGTCHTGKTYLYYNTGSLYSPSFDPNSPIELVATSGPNDYTFPYLADVDNDGDLDLFVSVSDANTGQVNFFRNQGNPTSHNFVLETAQWMNLSTYYILSIGGGDVDGDGAPNIFLSDYDRGMRQFRCKWPGLEIDPRTATVASGDSLDFKVHGEIVDVTFSLLADRSGASLLPSGTACQYIAGATAGVVDVIEVRDASGSPGRAYVNVISPDDIGRAGKAVIVAGWKGAGDPLWPDTARSTTNYLANFAYRTLLHRGFSKENIYYLSPDPAQDVDGDGANNDVDAESTLLNVQYALSDWAGQAPAPAKLLVYLVDHGGEQGAGQGYLRLNPGEVLLAQTVDAWLDALQVTHPGLEVTLAVDACRSGSFLDECLAPTGLDRVTLASAMDSQDAFFSAGGAISFSEAFFNSIYTGLSVGQSFTNAAGAMDRYQTAWLDDTGDGLWAKDEDGAAADARIIGATFIAGADRPQIGKINANQSIASGTSALLWAADVASVYPIEEVFAVIVPPSFQPNPDHDPEQPVTDLPRLDLTWNPSAARYEGTCNDFTETGAYKVVLYAKDIWDSLSYPKQTYVNQLGSTEKVVIVAGDTAFNAYSPWAYSNALANYAYRTCLDRWIGKERIRYFNGQSSQDVDGNGAADDVYASPGLAGLSDTMTGWASDALRLTVYLVGEMGEDRFQLTDTEALYSDQLASWLDILSASGVERITIVLEGDASGSFVDDLEGAGRNVIASCSAGGMALNQVDGMLSFSQFFWNKVLNGINVRGSFQFGRQAMRFLTAYAQQAAIQDNAGGALAVQTWIGAAFVTGEEAPTIGAVSEDGFYATGEAAMLWASQVSDPDGIAQVWALVVPPDYDPALDLIEEVTLAYNASQARYEAALNSLEKLGQYRVTFFAEDRKGNLSQPTQTTLLYGMDAYEEDDTLEQASLLYVNGPAQYHNFHDASDADWVKFYLFAGRGYSLEANSLEDRCDIVLNFRDSLGQLITQVNDWSGNAAEAIPYSATLTGAYYLEVVHADGLIYGASTGYELTVLDTGGGHNGLATSIGGRSALCSWDAASGARGYHLYRSQGDPGGLYDRANASEIAPISYLDEGLEPEMLYFYYVNKVEMDGTETDWTIVFYVLTGPEEPSAVIQWDVY